MADTDLSKVLASPAGNDPTDQSRHDKWEVRDNDNYQCLIFTNDKPLCSFVCFIVVAD